MQIIYIYQINLSQTSFFLGICNWWHVWCQKKLRQTVQFIQWYLRPDYEILVEGTAKQYAPHLRRWFSFCSKIGLQPVNADVTSGAEFLTKYFRKFSFEYSSVNTPRSALSYILPAVNGFTFCEQPLIKRILRGMFKEKSTLPPYTVTCDVTHVLDYVKNVLFPV